MTRTSSKSFKALLCGSALVALAACNGPLDYDLRDTLGGGLDTSAAAGQATAPRPNPDKRGIISYPNYQVAVARRGDTVADVAGRIGQDANALARYNGMTPETQLRQGEIVALPSRVAEPSAATGGTGVILPPSGVDIESIAGSAIDRAEPAGVTTTPLVEAPKPQPGAQTGIEPLRHKVQRGETAFTISRLYNVSVRSLAEWNGLGSDFTIREGQILLIPPVDPSAAKSGAGAAAAGAAATSAPGAGSVTPTPPSATKPLPNQTTKAVEKPASPDLGSSQSSSSARMGYPANGKIIRTYQKGKNNGIDISAAAGSPVMAADDGKVAAITKDADNVTIVVLRHDDNLMTVYYNVDAVKVSKGDSVRRGQTMAAIPKGDSFVHFEVRKGFDSVDPMPYLK
ncbi:peptidoglycan DD-metalloendopeptidase family protein [Shimia biformata]|uniref:peptidoglycan DD-metalloendopeptidase family protein n=1 Tax=Shimia biformata TaxID=1294299 RepID=UPI00195159F1|nr:peptidoglycan DD-metalloendopeptidase family protein [Shimia biformata]